jgi:hypothetical protein
LKLSRRTRRIQRRVSRTGGGEIFQDWRRRECPGLEKDRVSRTGERESVQDWRRRECPGLEKERVSRTGEVSVLAALFSVFSQHCTYKRYRMVFYAQSL